MQLIIIDNKWETMGSGCGSVGRAVVSDARGPQFKSSHQPNLYWTFIYLFTINCIEKTKINKEAGNGPLFFKKNEKLKWRSHQETFHSVVSLFFGDFDRQSGLVLPFGFVNAGVAIQNVLMEKSDTSDQCLKLFYWKVKKIIM